MKLFLVNLFTKVTNLFRTKLLINSGYVLGTYFVGAISGFLFWNLSSRYYLTKQVGVASSIISLSQFLFSIASLGIYGGLVRFFKGQKDQYKMLDTAVSVTIVTAILSAIIYLLGIKVWSPSLLMLRSFWPCLNFILLLIVTNLNIVIQMTFLALMMSKYAFWQMLILQIIRLILVVPLNFLGDQGIVFSLTLATCIANGIGFLFLIRCLPDYKPKVNISFGVLRTLIPFSVANGISDFLYNTPNFLLPLIVLELLGPDSSAYAYIAWMSLSVMQAPGWALAQSAFSEGSLNPKDLKLTIRNSILYGIVVSVGMTIAGIVVGPFFLGLFGSNYRFEGVGLLYWVAAGIPFATVNNILFSAFRVRKQLLSLINLNFISTAVFVGMMVIYLKRYGLSFIGECWFIIQVAVMVLAILIYSRPKIGIKLVPAENNLSD